MVVDRLCAWIGRTGAMAASWTVAMMPEMQGAVGRASVRRCDTPLQNPCARNAWGLLRGVDQPLRRVAERAHPLDRCNHNGGNAGGEGERIAISPSTLDRVAAQPAHSQP